MNIQRKLRILYGSTLTKKESATLNLINRYEFECRWALLVEREELIEIQESQNDYYIKDLVFSKNPFLEFVRNSKDFNEAYVSAPLCE